MGATMRIFALTVAFAAAVAFTSVAQAQCPSVSTGNYGTGCNPAGFDVPEIKGGFDTQNCQLTIKWSGNPGCCNTFLTGRLMIVGFAQAAVPAPGAGCTLLVQPTLVTFLPAAADHVVATIPPVPSLVNVFVQVANQYTTFGVQNDYNLTNGLQIKIV